ncbi:hypothetical protein [Vibrio tapetis]|uniref:Porin domain-containing protein n=1 Tax=Vibrio tapetis subsp. tapetis TaxID=1671868 RepID=A0A2N8ZDL0_9VIBR|nr:hypothetical protein [Vibrio tapetis]SON50007.1 conserved exported protein of unknown function [Vibrio tapetis subsp. tapetis]
MKLRYLSFAVMTASLPTHAAIELADGLTLSGFGSTSITRSDNENALFVNRQIGDSTCYDCDTIFGLQVDYNATDELRFSTQVVKRPQDEWSEPELEWLYASYEYNNLTGHIGRQRLPLFLASEYYFVGHAYLWARPPQDVYDSILGFTSYDGISIDWQTFLSDSLELIVTPFYGISSVETIPYGLVQLELESDYSVGLAIDLTGVDFRVHSAIMHNQYQIQKRPTEQLTIYTLGGTYSLQQWQIIAEIEHDDQQTAWNTSLAYHYDDWSPYITYGESHHRRKANNTIIGIRHYLTPQVSINAEWQTVRMTQEAYQDGHNGHFGFPPIYSGSDKDASLYTVMANFVF